MMDLNYVIEGLRISDKMVDVYGFPDDTANDLAIRTLTDQDLNLLLPALCEGKVTLENLIKVLPLRRLTSLIETAEEYMNVEGRGQEMIQIITYSGQLTAKDKHIRYKALISALEHFNIVIVSCKKNGERTEYRIELNEQER